MNRLCTLTLLLCVAVPFSYAQTDASTAKGAQSASPQNAPENSGNEIKGAFPITLVRNLDSKKLKEGDTVVCQTAVALHARSGLLIPTGSKVIGHVTQATARSKGNPDSTLGIVFDKIEISKGKDVPMKGTLQAVGPSLGGGGPDTGVAGGLGMGGGGSAGGTAADTATVAPPTSGGLAGPNSGIHPLDTKSKPILNAQSQGVLGIKNLEMGKDSVLTTTNKELKLDSGTQMMIRAEIEIPVM